MSNRDLIDDKLQEAEEEKKESVLDFIKKYKVLIIYCLVVLTYYVIRYVVIPGLH